MTDGNLWVVCDASGSMGEGGKRFLVRNLLAYLRQLARASDPAPNAVAWGDGVRPVGPDETVPLPCAGRVSAAALLDFLTPELARPGRPRLLVLSDGHWSAGELRRLLEWRRARPELAVRAVAVGADANAQALADFTGPGGVFAAEQIWAALESWGDATTSNEERHDH